MMKHSRFAAPLLLAALVAEAKAESYVRVLTDDASVRTGPATTFREVYRAPRGEVLEVIERSNQDFWFRVRLDDGTTGWIFGEFVFPFEVGGSDKSGLLRRAGRAVERAILAPSPIPYAKTEISFSAGILDGEGIFALRPQRIIDPMFAVEFVVGVSPRSDKTLLVGGIGPILRLAPGAPVGPYVGVSLAAAHIRPKLDNFIDRRETLMALAAGGGFEITFKKQITLRLDVRHWTFSDENRSNSGLEVTSGLAIFF